MVAKKQYFIIVPNVFIRLSSLFEIEQKPDQSQKEKQNNSTKHIRYSSAFVPNTRRKF